MGAVIVFALTNVKLITTKIIDNKYFELYIIKTFFIDILYFIVIQKNRYSMPKSG